MIYWFLFLYLIPLTFLFVVNKQLVEAIEEVQKNHGSHILTSKFIATVLTITPILNVITIGSIRKMRFK